MDFRVSRKEAMLQPKGNVMVLVSDVFDLFPEFGNPFDEKIITDVQWLNDPQAELLDRAMFGIVKQKGADPIDTEDGVDWSGYLTNEVPAGVLLTQVQNAVFEEGPGVQLTTSVERTGTSFQVSLTNPTQEL
jgi:hypothetical protein